MPQPPERILNGATLVLATHNLGKVKELQDLVVPFGCRVASALDFGVDAPEENGATFAENALIKARHSAHKTGKIALSDDSGLCIDILEGRPGIHSARYAIEAGGFKRAMHNLERELQGLEDPSACFVCALAIAFPSKHLGESGESLVFVGKVGGTLTFPMRGHKGFGYDSIFIPQGHTRTFAEMNPREKYALSHRAKAFEKMVRTCFRVD